MNQQGQCFPLSGVPVGLKREGGLALWVSDLVESITWQCQDREAEMQFVEIISPAVTIFTNAHNFPFTFLQAKKKKNQPACTDAHLFPVLLCSRNPPTYQARRQLRGASAPRQIFRL